MSRSRSPHRATSLVDALTTLLLDGPVHVHPESAELLEDVGGNYYESGAVARWLSEAPFLLGLAEKTYTTEEVQAMAALHPKLFELRESRRRVFIRASEKARTIALVKDSLSRNGQRYHAAKAYAAKVERRRAQLAAAPTEDVRRCVEEATELCPDAVGRRRPGCNNDREAITLDDVADIAGDACVQVKASRNCYDVDNLYRSMAPLSFDYDVSEFFVEDVKLVEPLTRVPLCAGHAAAPGRRYVNAAVLKSEFSRYRDMHRKLRLRAPKLLRLSHDHFWQPVEDFLQFVGLSVFQALTRFVIFRASFQASAPDLAAMLPAGADEGHRFLRAAASCLGCTVWDSDPPHPFGDANYLTLGALQRRALSDVTVRVPSELFFAAVRRCFAPTALEFFMNTFAKHLEGTVQAEIRRAARLLLSACPPVARRGATSDA